MLPGSLLVTNSPTQRQHAAAMKRNGARTRPVTPEQILRSFNTRAFKRENPDRPELMLEFVAQAHASGAPISFVLYWGKGLRPKLGAPEFICLDFLSAMMSRLDEVYEPGADFNLIFTDTHATLNGHSQASILSYLQDLVLAARPHGFNICRLSGLVNAAGLRIDERLEPQVPSAEMLAELRASAAKWFKAEGSAEEGAVRYFHANMVERKAVEHAFPSSIFVTFNGSRVKWLFPETLPIFYMYSLRRGTSDKPWFLPPDYTHRNSRLNGQSSELFLATSEAPEGSAS
jgi:L-tyrosine isonitrile synthase